MSWNLKNRVRWENVAGSGDSNKDKLAYIRQNMEWFDGFEKRQKELLAQLIAVASNNASSVITLGDTKFELNRSERYGIILYLRRELLIE